MFTFRNNIWSSDILQSRGISHGFSCRLGGVSALPHTASMNTGFFRGDSDETVRENIRLLCLAAGTATDVVCTPQIHSDIIRRVGRENVGEGTVLDVPFACDGFVCDESGVTLLIRVADCAPILLCGERPDGRPVIGAVHAGWRGTVAGIGMKAVRMLADMGAENIRCAVGACIHSCCFEVGGDFREAVADARGADYAARHIKSRGGKMFADLAEMNRELLLFAGAAAVDICPDCTCCHPDKYHSHRATGGKRGTMGAVISIL